MFSRSGRGSPRVIIADEAGSDQEASGGRDGALKVKEKGVKVGKIKFVKAVHSVPLAQYGVTHWVKKDKRVHVQGIGNFKISGLDQTPENAEFFYGRPRRKEGGGGGTTACKLHAFCLKRAITRTGKP